tara:strand:- start:516 stop:743 length:228 start_codon:yes stop_codon:yes gene_type:complete
VVFDFHFFPQGSNIPTNYGRSFKNQLEKMASKNFKNYAISRSYINVFFKPLVQANSGRTVKHLVFQKPPALAGGI